MASAGAWGEEERGPRRLKKGTRAERNKEKEKEMGKRKSISHPKWEKKGGPTLTKDDRGPIHLKGASAIKVCTFLGARFKLLH